MGTKWDVFKAKVRGDYPPRVVYASGIVAHNDNDIELAAHKKTIKAATINYFDTYFEELGLQKDHYFEIKPISDNGMEWLPSDDGSRYEIRLASHLKLEYAPSPNWFQKLMQKIGI